MKKKARMIIIFFTLCALVMGSFNVYGDVAKMTFADSYLLFNTWQGNGTSSVSIGDDFLTQGSGIAKYNEFEYLQFEKNKISNDNYLILEKDGNTIITLEENYLKTLKDGTYLFKAVFARTIIPIKLHVVTHKIDMKDAYFSFATWTGKGDAEVLLDSQTFSYTFHRELFNQLEYKGKKVEETDYTISNMMNTTKITIKEQYLKTLPEGVNYFTADFLDVRIMLKLNKSTITTIGKTQKVRVNPKNKKLSITWKKQNNVNGYIIKIGTNKKISRNKRTVWIKKNKTVIKNLKANKVYFLKVRAYKSVNGNKKYGEWSKLIRCKTKK